MYDIPDTFASKVAAIQDSTADNSVGNVTGSNAVNVFLGIGIAWSLASFYHNIHGQPFKINSGKYVSRIIYNTPLYVYMFVHYLRLSMFTTKNHLFIFRLSAITVNQIKFAKRNID